MQYPVRCECGKVHRVPGSLAGSRLTCTCGRDFEVPALSRLRHLAGQEVLSPEVRLAQMIELGMLPARDDCVICGAHTPETVHVWAICESVKVETPDTRGWLLLVPITLLFGFITALFFTVMYSFRRGGDKEYGSDIRLRLPLRVCRRCAPKMQDRATLEQATWSVPAFEELLDKYPGTELALEAEKPGVNLNRIRA